MISTCFFGRDVSGINLHRVIMIPNFMRAVIFLFAKTSVTFTFEESRRPNASRSQTASHVRRGTEETVYRFVFC